MWRRALTLAIAAAIIAVAGGSSAAGGVAQPAAADLSTRQGAVSYLRSLGLRPDGFVIQRGTRNYAGPKCPGKGWTCTTSTRVLQISTAGTNVGNCNGTNLSGTGAAYACEIVQETGGSNAATCTLTTDDSGDGTPTGAITQNCTIKQKVLSTGKKTGKNTATITQRINAARAGTGCASLSLLATDLQCVNGQSASIAQTNSSGPNEAYITQAVNQSLVASGPVASQAQATTMTFDIRQNYPASNLEYPFDGFDPATCSTIQGSATAVVSQSVAQTEDAGAATTGLQLQNSSLNGHVNQCSNANSTFTVTQDERQTQLPNIGVPGIKRTQLGPIGCCSFQGTNPGDGCTIDQTANQQSPGAVQIDSILSKAQSYGNCDATATVTQNGAAPTTITSDGGGASGVGVSCFSGQRPCRPVRPAETATRFRAGSLTVTPVAPETAVEYSDAATLSATVERTDTGAALEAGLPVTLAVHGNAGERCAALTNANGTASCTIAALSDTPPSQTLDASFDGAGPYAAATGSASFVIAKEPTALAYEPATATTVFKDNRGFVTLTAKLTEDGAPLLGKTITFTTNGLAASCQSPAVTSSTGVATCKTKPASGNDVVVTGAYAGDAFYVNSGFGPITLTFTH
jgi:hypothetical protein